MSGQCLLRQSPIANLKPEIPWLVARAWAWAATKSRFLVALRTRNWECPALPESGDGHLEWSAKVASGIYMYLVVSADGMSSKVGKLSVIR
ncbi:MAG TPA: hypothetical protein VMH22_04265 [bacterium]|nr:hypothetical protein [bacterium]